MGPADWAALSLYLLVWLGYEPILSRVARASGAITTDLSVLRTFWMRAMATRRDTRLLDGQLLGHVITSASFFTSSNLILTAGVAGVLFGGHATLGKANEIGFAAGSLLLFQAKLALVFGQSLFIWPESGRRPTAGQGGERKSRTSPKLRHPGRGARRTPPGRAIGPPEDRLRSAMTV
jgi:uncharacterized membrane protein